MWSARFEDDGPGLLNAELADEYGVIMGMSHHERVCGRVRNTNICAEKTVFTEMRGISRRTGKES